MIDTTQVVIDSIARLCFEIDDMTSEELAVAMEQIRMDNRVVDASFQLCMGKKGRPQFSVAILAYPIEIGGANCDPWVRLYCGGNDGRDWAWCAGFVSLIMHQAYFYREDKPPIAGSVSCDTLAAQAKATDLFVHECEITSGRHGWNDFGAACIFLRRRTSTDWTHTGIATAGNGVPNDLVFSTIEGNTNDEGVGEGFEACRRKRGVAGANYDFIAFT